MPQLLWNPWENLSVFGILWRRKSSRYPFKREKTANSNCTGYFIAITQDNLLPTRSAQYGPQGFEAREYSGEVFGW